MTDSSWELLGVDPAALQRAAEEAARRGVTVADYLTQTLGAAVAKHSQLPENPAMSDTSAVLETRRRTLARRLGSAADSLEGAIDALDHALGEFSERVGSTEAATIQTAEALSEAFAELEAARRDLASLRQAAAAEAETNQNEHAELAAACVTLGRRIEAAEAAARQAAALAAESREALKSGAADEFARVNAGLNEVRRSADAAAEQAEAAAAHVVAELRGVREMLEARLSDNAADARARIQAAFAETSERIAGLSNRIAGTERAQARSVEQLRVHIADVEAETRSALADTAAGLRTADAELAARIEQLHEQTKRNEANRAGAAAALEIAELRSALERRISEATVDARGRFAKTQDEWEARLEALVSRLDRQAAESGEIRQLLHAESDRVEACTLAALEKLSGDIAGGDAATEAKLHAALRTADARIEETNRRAEHAAGELHRQHAGLAERVERLTAGLSLLQADVAPLNERLTRLERLESRAEAEQAAIIALAQRVGHLEQRQSEGLDALRADMEAFMAESDDRLAALHVAAPSDPREIVDQFVALRQRVEDRIAALESKSVRMLEQVAETVALLDKRLNGTSDHTPAARSA